MHILMKLKSKCLNVGNIFPIQHDDDHETSQVCKYNLVWCKEEAKQKFYYYIFPAFFSAKWDILSDFRLFNTQKLASKIFRIKPCQCHKEIVLRFVLHDLPLKSDLSPTKLLTFEICMLKKFHTYTRTLLIAIFLHISTKKNAFQMRNLGELIHTRDVIRSWAKKATINLASICKPM